MVPFLPVSFAGRTGPDPPVFKRRFFDYRESRPNIQTDCPAPGRIEIS